MIGGLLDLGHHAAEQARWANPYHAKRKAIERCIERASNPARLGALEHALDRVSRSEKIYNALTEAAHV